jgi:hypothetical protein
LCAAPSDHFGIKQGLALLNNNSHHSHRDELAGTEVYGTYGSERSQATFSIAYSALITPTTEVMFVTGNRADYIVTRFVDFATTGEYPLNHSRTTTTREACLCASFVVSVIFKPLFVHGMAVQDGFP